MSFADQRGWWFSQSNSQYMAQEYTDTDTGFKESLEVIQQACTEQVQIGLNILG